MDYLESLLSEVSVYISHWEKEPHLTFLLLWNFFNKIESLNNSRRGGVLKDTLKKIEGIIQVRGSEYGQIFVLIKDDELKDLLPEYVGHFRIIKEKGE